MEHETLSSSKVYVINTILHEISIYIVKTYYLFSNGFSMSF